jgi:hypothetical protein
VRATAGHTWTARERYRIFLLYGRRILAALRSPARLYTSRFDLYRESQRDDCTNSQTRQEERHGSGEVIFGFGWKSHFIHC